MALKVALLYGGISRCGFQSYGVDSEGSWLSHGLGSISAYAKSLGYQIDLIDLRALSGWDAYRQQLRDGQWAVIGATMMSVDYQMVMKALQLAKATLPAVVTIVGGVHPSVMPDDCARGGQVDVVVRGEGELTFVDLLREIEAGRVPRGVITGRVPDLERLPPIDRSLFPGAEEPLINSGFPTPFVTTIAGRGCRYNCSFCQPAERMVFGKRVRRRSVGNVIGELELLQRRQPWESLFIHDDCLTEDPAWVREFAAAYTARGFRQPFACQSRADFICRQPELIELLARAGLRFMIVGFESGSQRLLDFLKKGTTVEQNLEAARILHRHGIGIWANYMLGIPTETRDEALATAAMILEIRPAYCSPAFFTPHPGSDLFEYCRENRLSLIEHYDSYRRNPTEPKIAGIDYPFLNEVVRLSQGVFDGLDALAGRLDADQLAQFRHWQRDNARTSPASAAEPPHRAAYRQGLALLAQQRWRDGIEQFTAVVGSAAADHALLLPAYYHLGSAYRRIGEIPAAREMFARVIELDRGGHNRIVGGAHFHLGEIALQQGEREAAREWFARCLELMPDHRQAAKYLDLDARAVGKDPDDARAAV